jgi:hypothetical protein
MEEYEAKISKLMRHARQRTRKDNPEAARQWEEAIRELSKGDHYILLFVERALIPYKWNRGSALPSIP